ncbi:hypothetical protein [Cupriavidus alkaliphilus]|uniref:hypothetical protein n=1 Tax=Cupriavidus alkaliphilus TaxID=942866 RepID=UPI0011BE6F02|nr:hypothetical protein [Cupriavidus alkaliphilus]
MATMLARFDDPARASPMRPAGALPDCKECAIAGKARFYAVFQARCAAAARFDGDGPRPSFPLRIVLNFWLNDGL